ncbi:hypothetical protein [Terriglobus saanensis]|uniref:Uncharacterized protein n=1 Tax=Terriglobus saanensis (strain ATCC BAA-1853 / DSM 23119 / SP1PR4) TaxID=401053 RepID=E8V0E0_TERSS|nr:hypothetical protein [Terriglobus saanensis]ADV84423.1 hypothetical protein AciPR4_3671 [Terriglobus saanensis SP1PR4]
MRKPHIASTIKSLAEPWFIGSPLGLKYGILLNDALALNPDRDRIEEALALGNYTWHTQSNKHQREALRAVLLASFLMKGQPHALRDSLYARYKDENVEFLTREFKHLFPAIADLNNNRDSWAPHHFTAPNTLNAYRRPRNWATGGAPPYQFITHGVRCNVPVNVLDNPIPTLSEWWCISMGVQRDRKPDSFSNHGVILRVPKENILTTSPTDQWFDNYAGTDASVRAPGVTLVDHIIDKSLRIGGLLTPTQIITRQGTPGAIANFAGADLTSYNEIVVCGVPNIKMPFGGGTGPLQLLGVFIQTRMDGTLPNFYFGSQGHFLRVETAAMACAVVNNVPLLYLPNPTL